MLSSVENLNWNIKITCFKSSYHHQSKVALSILNKTITSIVSLSKIVFYKYDNAIKKKFYSSFFSVIVKLKYINHQKNLIWLLTNLTINMYVKNMINKCRLRKFI